jgi:hypothetical protein
VGGARGASARVAPERRPRALIAPALPDFTRPSPPLLPTWQLPPGLPNKDATRCWLNCILHVLAASTGALCAIDVIASRPAGTDGVADSFVKSLSTGLRAYATCQQAILDGRQLRWLNSTILWNLFIVPQYPDDHDLSKHSCLSYTPLLKLELPADLSADGTSAIGTWELRAVCVRRGSMGIV